MPTSYNFTENGVVYNFDDIFIRRSFFTQTPTSIPEVADDSEGAPPAATEGTLRTWGRINVTGDGGVGSNRLTPVTTLAGGTNWSSIVGSNSAQWASALKSDGTLWVWGLNADGQIGISGLNVLAQGTTDTNTRFTPTTTFAGGTNWKQVSAGRGHCAAVKTDGTLWTWGRNANNQLGRVPSDRIIIPITPFGGGTNWADTATTNADDLHTINTGNRCSAAIKTDGTLWTWGYAGSGRLGNNENLSALRMTPITTFAGGTNWREVSVGKDTLSGNATMGAIKTDGTLWMWGANSYGQLGLNDTTIRPTPVTTLTGGTNWSTLSVGFTHNGAIKTDGTLWTWGRDSNGSLGRNAYAQILIPITPSGGGTTWANVATTNANDLYTITTSPESSAAVKTDGTLWVWGTNGNYGKLGTNDFSGRTTPVTTFAGGTNWRTVCVPQFTTGRFCSAIKTDGTLWTWGRAVYGVLGNNDQVTTRISPITTFAGGTNWKQVACGRSHMVAVKTDGTLWSWGRNTNGQLGVNDTTNRLTPVTTFAGGTNWASVSAGDRHTGSVKTDGTLWTWGYRAYGRLGINVSAFTSQLTPATTFAGGTNWKQVSCGAQNTAAVKTDGTLWTWGRNYFGQLGVNSSSTNRLTPVTTFTGGTNWTQVSCTYGIAGIKTDGTLWVWGRNTYGQLGTNDTSQKNTPVTTFLGGSNWKQVFCGYEQTIALLDDTVNKRIYFMGRNSFLAGGLPVSDKVPTQIDASTTWSSVSVGRLAGAAIKTDGTLWTWGNNGNGQLGVNDATSRLTPVTTFAGGTNWKQVSCAYTHMAAVKTDGTLWAWGNGNTYARLGDNQSSASRLTPVTTFAGGTNWTQVSSGNDHTAAVKTDGTLWIWGRGNYGQLGDNTLVNKNTPVTTFLGGTTWKQVSAGRFSTLALSDDGVNKRIYAFGRNAQGEGGTLLNQVIPTQIDSSTNWSTVHSAYESTGAVKTDGTLWTWGRNTYGNLGTNDSTTRSTPTTTFAGGTNWSSVFMGRRSSAAIKTDGTLWTWGYNGNAYGSLGIGNPDFTTRLTPVTTFAGGTNWSNVSVGYNFMTAVKTDGTLWSWGTNANRRLGRTATNQYSTPTTTFVGGTNWRAAASPSAQDFYTLSGSGTMSMATKADGTLWVWGINAGGHGGQLGINNDLAYRPTPVTTFAGGTNWRTVALSAVGGNTAAAIKTDGTLWLWGVGTTSQLGNQDNTSNRSTPVTTFTGGTTWRQVSVGFNHCAAVKTDGTLWTWGVNNYGQCATNDSINKVTPVTTFAGGTDWRTVSAGTQSCSAIKTGGTLWTWGRNNYGQLGINLTTNRSTPVTTFLGGTTWKQVSMGRFFTGATKTDGTLWMWGNGGQGRLGINDSFSTKSTPVTTFAGGTNWDFVSCGGYHTAALKNDATLWTWGRGTEGQCGNATFTATILTPVTTFAGGSTWRQVFCGLQHTLAYTDSDGFGTNGRIFAFGNNNNFTCGSFNDQIIPAQIDNAVNWVETSAGERHGLARKTDGSLWVWGNNPYGQLGTNDTTLRSTPVTTFAGGSTWIKISGGYQNSFGIN